MERRMSGCALLALMLLPAAEAAEPGFYIGATASRVEHDISGPGVAVAFIPVGGFVPLPGSGVIITPRPVPPILNPISPIIVATERRVEVDDGQAGWSLSLGYRVSQYFAAEVAYVDFGETTVTQTLIFDSQPPFPPFVTRYDIGVSGPAVSVLGTLPIGAAWQLFLRGGVLFADQEVDFNGSPSGFTYSDELAMAGAGVQWSFASRWTARLEYQRTDDLQNNPVADDSRLEQASLSVLFKL